MSGEGNRGFTSLVVFGSLVVVLAVLTGVVLWQALQTDEQGNRAGLAGVLGIGIDAGDRQEEADYQAESALLWDSKQGQILYEQNGFERRPIASITKLMTAMVAIDVGIDWEARTSILPEEHVVGSKLWLAPGETVTMRDLFHASLLGSANNATLAYVRELPTSEEEFVLAMNRKAVELELEQTVFTDVTGLETGNVSTAYEVGVLAAHAFTHYPEIAEASRMSNYTFVVGETDRETMIRNSNRLVGREGWEVTGSKTGFLYEAGWCLVVSGTGKWSDRVAVILGGVSEDTHWHEAKRLLELKV